MTVFFIYRQPEFDVLKYALRGVEKYVDFDQIYVVGDVPDWREHESIQTEPNANRFADVYNSLKAIRYINWNECLLMNDDIFITKPYKPISYYKGTLEAKIKGKFGRSSQLFRHTLEKLPGILNHALHRPIPVKRGRFDMVMDLFDQPFSYTCAMSGGYPLVQANDCKFRTRFTYEQCRGLDMFSTYNESDWIVPILEKVYPKCVY